MAELFADKSFDLNSTSEYNLSIQVNLNGFSFIITDSIHQNLIAIKNESLKISSDHFLAKRLAEWIDAQELLIKIYKQVKVLFWTSKFTLIPDEYFSEEKNTALFHHLFGPEKNRVIKENTISGINSKLLFQIPNDLHVELDKRHNNLSYIHPVELLLQQLPETNTSDDGLIMLLLSSTCMYVLVFKTNKLLVVNSYNYSNFNDILYFILSNLRECELAPDKTKLLLSGNINSEILNETETGFRKYIGSVESLQTTLKINSEIFENAELRNTLLLLK